MTNYTMMRTHVRCRCGQELKVYDVEEDHMARAVGVQVEPHKCVDCEKELRLKITGHQRTIEMYKTKLENFKEFAKLMRGL